MRQKFALAVIMTVTLAGCASYKRTMTDSQGHTLTCEASGKAGIVTGIYLRQGFDNCVAAAEAKGYS